MQKLHAFIIFIPPNPPTRSRDLKTSPCCIGTKKCESELKCLRCRISDDICLNIANVAPVSSEILRLDSKYCASVRKGEAKKPKPHVDIGLLLIHWFMSDSIHCLSPPLPKNPSRHALLGVFLVTWVIFGSNQQLWEMVQTLLTAMLCTRSPMELMSLCGGHAKFTSLDWILESTLKVVANPGIAGIPTSSSGPLRMV